MNNKVLIILQDKHLGTIYAKRLLSERFEVEIYDNYSEGMRHASRFKPDILYLDATCVEDIYDAIHAMRTSPVHNAMKIVLIVNNVERKQLKKIVRQVDGCLLEGQFIPQELIARTRSLLNT